MRLGPFGQDQNDEHCAAQVHHMAIENNDKSDHCFLWTHECTTSELLAPPRKNLKIYNYGRYLRSMLVLTKNKIIKSRYFCPQRLNRSSTLHSLMAAIAIALYGVAEQIPVASILRRLANRCGNLVEQVGPSFPLCGLGGHSRKLQPVHQTVKYFSQLPQNARYTFAGSQTQFLENSPLARQRLYAFQRYRRLLEELA